MTFIDAVNSRSMLKFLWFVQSIDQDIDFLRVCRSRFFEVHCSTTARWIKFIFGMMFIDAVLFRSMLKFAWSDQSIDQDIDVSACVAVTLFRWSMLIRFVQNTAIGSFFRGMSSFCTGNLSIMKRYEGMRGGTTFSLEKSVLKNLSRCDVQSWSSCLLISLKINFLRECLLGKIR